MEDSIQPEEREKLETLARCCFSNQNKLPSLSALTGSFFQPLLLFKDDRRLFSRGLTVSPIFGIPGPTGFVVASGSFDSFRSQFSGWVNEFRNLVQERQEGTITDSSCIPNSRSRKFPRSGPSLQEAEMLLSTTIQPAVHVRSARSIQQLQISVSVCLDCGTPVPARLLELTRQDLMILTDRPLRYGTYLQLAMFGNLMTSVTQNRGLVHLCRPNQQGWQIGAFLAMPLPNRLTEREWSDLDDSLRYECNWRAWVLWDGDGKLEPVLITGYSIGGISLDTKRIVPHGSKFTLFGSNGSKDRSALNGEVQWTRQNADGVHLGCHIHGQRGRDLPKMFGNLDSVHIAPDEDQSSDQTSDSFETQTCELAAAERFLPTGLAYETMPSTSFPCTSVSR